MANDNVIIILKMGRKIRKAFSTIKAKQKNLAQLTVTITLLFVFY